MRQCRSVPTCCDSCERAGADELAARRHIYKSAVFPPPSRGGPGGNTRSQTASTPGRPEVAVGTVLDVSPHVLVISGAGAERRMTLSPGATAWRGRTREPTAVRAGDRAFVRLCPGRRDVADKIWAGIGRVTGTILQRSGNALLVDEGVTRQRQNVVISSRAANRIQVRFPQLSPGHLVDLIGLRRDDATLEALVPATSQPANPAASAPRRSGVAVSRSGRIKGSVTWHEPTGPEADADALAYPAVDPSAGCAEAAAADSPACSALPYLAVGSMLVVRNECTGLSRTLPVTRCGAVARLFCDRCMTCGTSPRLRIADLSLASFIRLGGELERGCFNATLAIGW